MKVVMQKWDNFKKEYPNSNILISTLIFLLALVIILSIISNVFLTPRNIINILTQCSVYLILGVGMTLVMDSGGIDISIGSIIGLATTFLGTFAVGLGYPWYLALLVCLFIAVLCGVFNGLFIVKFKVPPIIVTLGTMTMFRGIAYAYQEGTVYYGFPQQILYLARGRILGLPVPIWIALVVLIWGQYFLTKTRAGRHITALGGNEKAARLAGVNVGLLQFLVYLIMGVLSGIATLILTARLDASQAISGSGMELHVIAAAVVGGTTLSGGRGLMLGTLLGVLILGVLENGLLLAGIGYYWQRVLLGFIFILVVAIRTFREKQKTAA